MTAPNWVQELVMKVLIDQGFDEIPNITWRRAKREGSSGHAGNWDVSFKRGITITAGKGRKDQKLVLLHELAHWLTPNEGHSQKFWDKAFELYKVYKVPIRYAYSREIGYKRLAEVSYRKVQGLKPKKLKRVSHIMKTITQLNKKLGYRTILEMRDIPTRTGRQFWAVYEYANEEHSRWYGFRVTAELYSKLC